MGGYVEVGGQFEVVLLGAVGDGLQQACLRCRQCWPVADGYCAGVAEAPLFSQGHVLAQMFGLLETRCECAAVLSQLPGQGIDMTHTQFDELFGFFRAFPGRVLTAPDRREPFANIDLCRARNQRGEVTVEF